MSLLRNLRERISREQSPRSRSVNRPYTDGAGVGMAVMRSSRFTPSLLKGLSCRGIAFHRIIVRPPSSRYDALAFTKEAGVTLLLDRRPRPAVPYSPSMDTCVPADARPKPRGRTGR